MIECPHCYTNVIAKADGTCPACREDTRRFDPARRERSSVDLAHGERLPPLCIECGVDTDRTRCVSRSVHLATSAESAVSVGMGLLLGMLLARLMGIGRVYVRVDLPLCRSCAAKGSPRPARVSFEEHTMTFVVHRTFKERLAQVRAK